MPYWGMNRKEVWGLMALIAVASLGFGVQAYLRVQREGAVWGEHGPDAPQAAKISDGQPDRFFGPAREENRDTRPGFSERPTKPTPSANSKAWRADGRLDLNRAESADLETLTRIGPSRARDILAYRQSHGKFHSARELLEVPGIGEKTWKMLEPLIYVEPSSATEPVATSVSFPESAQPPAASQAVASVSSQISNSNIQKIDLNRATVAELESLWNIGPQKAQAIVQWRQTYGGFRLVEDLLKVPGIGPQTLERNRERLTVSPGS